MDTWDVLKELAGSVNGPSDWSSQHDHYLYGTPKRDLDNETPSARVITAMNELESGGGEVFDNVDDLIASWERE